MRRILLPVDGSERALDAVRTVLRERDKSGEVEVHLLNVQPRVFPEQTALFMPADRADTYYYEQSGDALAPAERVLRDAGVSFTAHRAVGPVAETIADKARELGCDAIVMSTRGHGKIAGMLLGSVSTKMLHLASVPVMLINDRSGVDFSGRLQAS